MLNTSRTNRATDEKIPKENIGRNTILDEWLKGEMKDYIMRNGRLLKLERRAESKNRRERPDKNTLSELKRT